jgi:hypothetical protein
MASKETVLHEVIALSYNIHENVTFLFPTAYLPLLLEECANIAVEATQARALDTTPGCNNPSHIKANTKKTHM